MGDKQILQLVDKMSIFKTFFEQITYGKNVISPKYNDSST